MIAQTSENRVQRGGQFFRRHLTSKKIPQFRGDETPRLRMVHHHLKKIFTIEVASLAENNLFAAIVRIGTLDELLRPPLIGPARQGARSFRYILFSVVAF